MLRVPADLNMSLRGHGDDVSFGFEGEVRHVGDRDGLGLAWELVERVLRAGAVVGVDVFEGGVAGLEENLGAFHWKYINLNVI